MLDNKIEKILKKLGKYGFKATNDSYPFTGAEEAHITGDFSFESVKRTNLKYRKVEDAVFSSAAVTGSYFEKCDFQTCKLDNADYEYCNFKECDFHSVPLDSISFNNSFFLKCNFLKSSFVSCTLTGTYFTQTLFKNMSIEHCTLEGSLFEECIFYNTNMVNLNFEYAQFKNMRFYNAKLPFSQLPYIFGGITCLTDPGNDISISADNKTFLSTQEYIENGLPLLCQYYQEIKAHFPLANIYIGLKQYSKAYEELKLGMQQSVITKDFRMLKYYCKLAVLSNKFSYKDLNNMYKMIQTYFSMDTLSEQQLYNYSKHIGEIKTLLLSKYDEPKMSFTIKTNIEPDCFKLLSSILSDIFDFKSQLCSENHASKVILAENSPFIITVDISDDYLNLYLFALVLIVLSEGKCKLYESYVSQLSEAVNVIASGTANTLNSLLVKAEERHQYYIQNQIALNVDEMLFLNISKDLKLPLQYFNTKKQTLIEGR